MLRTMRCLAGMIVALSLLAVAALGGDDPECTVHVQPGESIQAAIDAAPAGAVICVGEGEWQEDLVIRKAITLKGAGAGQTTIHGTGEAMDVVAVFGVGSQGAGTAHVRVEALSVAGAMGRAGISIEAEIQAVASNCDVRENHAGILLMGSSDAKIEHCTVTSNSEGINGFDSARATIASCAVSGNTNGGVAFAFSAEATISDSSFSENGAFGLYLSGSAQASVSSTAIADNGSNGLRLKGASQATFANCDVTNNGYDYAEKGRHDTQAIGLDEEAQASFTGCTISGNVTDGINVAGNAQAEITESTISGNGRVGVFLWDTARATLDDCIISDHPSAGIDAREETSVEIRGCTISDNFEGVYLWEPRTPSSSEARFDGARCRGSAPQGRTVRSMGSPGTSRDGATWSSTTRHLCPAIHAGRSTCASLRPRRAESWTSGSSVEPRRKRDGRSWRY